MTIKDIIEKLEKDKSSNKVYMKTLTRNAAKYSYICGLLDWIKSNFEEESGEVEVLGDYRGWSFFADIEIHPYESRIILQNIYAHNFERLKCPLILENIEGNSSLEVRRKLKKAINVFESSNIPELINRLKEDKCH